MTFEEYREEIRNGEREEWYGELVPRKLITARVRAIATMVEESLNKMEMELDEIHGNSKQKESKKRYIDQRWDHIKTLPYHSNGLINDVYMVKYKKIIAEIEKEEESKKKTKPKTRKPRTKKADTKPKVEKPTSVKNTQVETKPKEESKKEEPTTTVVKSRRGRNSKLIFGK
jgi:outer membrane biosynthesis protein TonB